MSGNPWPNVPYGQQYAHYANNTGLPIPGPVLPTGYSHLNPQIRPNVHTGNMGMPNAPIDRTTHGNNTGTKTYCQTRT